ncbi:Eukaryotic translation initiation factor 3 subunit C [Saguinus oedipus]|uniref:Eukaryotic translation initiation factor 3 subunit C n=1 Tax=Saguinus oedipus TaxID=9490 RepID=A0ABQ9V6Y0_SAGOE|nr:Eukaryotic translation initiation factor 3 subunit C [Saguinus oedipus]
MDEEFTKIMQNTDPHSQVYAEHLKDEAQVCDIIERSDYEARQRSPPEGSSKSDQDQAENEGEDSAVLTERLCRYFYAKGRTDRIRMCAILCHIYHHARRSCWHQARDLMPMSHLQGNIQHADPPPQNLHDRTTVHPGICASAKA